MEAWKRQSTLVYHHSRYNLPKKFNKGRRNFYQRYSVYTVAGISVWEDAAAGAGPHHLATSNNGDDRWRRTLPSTDTDISPLKISNDLSALMPTLYNTFLFSIFVTEGTHDCTEQFLAETKMYIGTSVNTRVMNSARYRCSAA